MLLLFFTREQKDTTGSIFSVSSLLDWFLFAELLVIPVIPLGQIGNNLCLFYKRLTMARRVREPGETEYPGMAIKFYHCGDSNTVMRPR